MVTYNTLDNGKAGGNSLRPSFNAEIVVKQIRPVDALIGLCRIFCLLPGRVYTYNVKL
jgi:hypothetical protein